MIQIFDMFNNPEKPQIILTKPTGEEIFEIGYYSGLSIDDKYNDVSQITFTVYREHVQDYDEIKGKKYLNISNYGIYIIDDVKDTSDGKKESKLVICKSVDFELSYKRITLEADIYKLYDSISTEDTLLGRIIKLIPSWSIGTVDTDVSSKYRYFDVEDKTLLQFLYADLEDAFQAVAEIDYETRTINIVAISNIGTNSDIYISHDNLAETIVVSEISNEIVTNLYAYGGNGLNIRGVNPSGTNDITNLDYFKTTEWMSQDLINALDSYEILYDSKKTTYNNLLISLKNNNIQLLNLETEYSLLNNELTALNTLRVERIQAGISIGTLYNDIKLKETEMSLKASDISNKEAQINSILNSLLSIVDDLSIENNFTQSQIEDIDKLTIEYTYQNEAYIITDTMTEAEIQEQEELLLADATEILERLSQPRFSFSISVVDFLKLSDYNVFIEQFELATIINIELPNGTIVETRLISYKHDWDDNKLSLEFTSKYRTNDPTYLYNELYKKSVDAGNSVSFSKYQYNTWNRNSKDEVTTFISSSLNAAVNNVVSSVDQNIIIDTNGLRARQSDGLGGYLDEQLWIVNNMIALSDDDFANAKIAIGKIQDSQYGELWGIVAPNIVGNLLAGNNLRITNTANQFLLDESGATLTDATFTLNTTNGKGRIILDPDQGIRVQGNSTGTLQDKFYVDNNGNVIFAGTLSGVNGTFSGTVSAGTITGSNIIGSNISATNIVGGSIISAKLTSADIVGGTISAIDINSANIDISQDISIGNNIYLGDTGLNDDVKRITFLSNFGGASQATIQASRSNYPNDNYSLMTISAYDVNFNTFNPPKYNNERLATQDWVIDNAGVGDITAVYSGAGLNGGGTSGAVSLSVDDDKVVTQNQGAGVSSSKLQFFSDHLEVLINGDAHVVATW